MRISQRLVEAVKLHHRPAYTVAWEAGIHPSTLSKLLHGAERVRAGDPRVLEVARIVGVVPQEAFGPEEPSAA